MSNETSKWLNTNVLIGDTDERGHAWHYRAEDQGDESNHYPGAIPAEDVARRLFNWEPVKIPSFGQRPDGSFIQELSECKIWRPDTDTIIGHVGADFVAPSHREALLEEVQLLLDNDLHISSVGQLRGGAIAWLEVNLAHTVSYAGLDYRPNLLGATALNGWMSQTWRRAINATVCDNTLAANLKDDTDVIKISHRVNSRTRITEARDALKLQLVETDEQFRAEVDRLTNMRVSDPRFERWAAAYAGVAGKPKEDWHKTSADKVEQLITLWREDERVAPWHGTGLGVLQAANTFQHHFTKPRGADASRADRNMEKTIKGDMAKADRSAMKLLASIK